MKAGQSPEVTASIAVGANLGDAIATVNRALILLDRIDKTRVHARSDIYQSKAVGPPGQPDYVNAVALITTSLAPLKLLDSLQSMEDKFGRYRSAQRWDSRTLDLDIVTYGNQEIFEERLTVPHPESHHRCFVLVPLAQIAPEVMILGHGKVRDLVDDCDTGKVYKIKDKPT